MKKKPYLNVQDLLNTINIQTKHLRARRIEIDALRMTGPLKRLQTLSAEVERLRAEIAEARQSVKGGRLAQALEERDTARAEIERLRTELSASRSRTTHALESLDAMAAERDALREQLEQVKQAVRWAPSSAHWSEVLLSICGPDAREGINSLEHQLRGQMESAKGLSEQLARESISLNFWKDRTESESNIVNELREQVRGLSVVLGAAAEALQYLGGTLHAERCRAALAAVREPDNHIEHDLEMVPAPDCWQPIETAPKNVLVLVNNGGVVEIARLFNTGRWFNTRDFECSCVHHWTPLPRTGSPAGQKGGA